MITNLVASIILGIGSVQELPQKVAHGESCGYTTYYDNWYHGRQTASGATHDRYKVSAASWHFPIGTWLRVTNRSNGRVLDIEVNDKGGYELLDLSEEASIILGSSGQPDNHAVCVQVL